MALNKVNLVRLKRGDAPSQGSVVVYEAGSTGLYNTKTSGEFVDEISPLIKTSSIYNDQPFYDTTTVPVKDLKVKGDGGNVNVVSPTNQTLDLGSNENPVFPNGAYSQHWHSTEVPPEASGSNGDLWFKLG